MKTKTFKKPSTNTVGYFKSYNSAGGLRHNTCTRLSNKHRQIVCLDRLIAEATVTGVTLRDNGIMTGKYKGTKVYNDGDSIWKQFL